MEGPSLIIAREDLAVFAGLRAKATGAAKLDFARISNEPIERFESHGKHFLICYADFYLRIHFLMFGSFRVDDRREDREPKLRLDFGRSGEINFYSCAIRLNEGSPEAQYDWSIDPLSEKWDEVRALEKIAALPPETFVCDLLMDQTIFAGVGNIIKNEVLFARGLHTERRLGTLDLAARRALVRCVVNYCYDFYAWKRMGELKRHWVVFRRKDCASCGVAVEKTHTGLLERASFHCPVEQR